MSVARPPGTPMRTRRRLLECAGSAMVAPWLLSFSSASAGPAPAALPRPRSLAAALDEAVALRKALVLLVSLEGCPYCKLVRESYLLPMRAEGQPVVQLELTGPMALLDAQGQAATHAQVVRAWGVRVAPTVLFLGRGGTEAAPRLEGVASPDFYGAYLQERTEAANRMVAG
jgi:hypothetical protein